MTEERAEPEVKASAEPEETITPEPEANGVDCSAPSEGSENEAPSRLLIMDRFEWQYYLQCVPAQVASIEAEYGVTLEKLRTHNNGVTEVKVTGERVADAMEALEASQHQVAQQVHKMTLDLPGDVNLSEVDRLAADTRDYVIQRVHLTAHIIGTGPQVAHAMQQLQHFMKGGAPEKRQRPPPTSTPRSLPASPRSPPSSTSPSIDPLAASPRTPPRTPPPPYQHREPSPPPAARLSSYEPERTPDPLLPEPEVRHVGEHSPHQFFLMSHNAAVTSGEIPFFAEPPRDPEVDTVTGSPVPAMPFGEDSSGSGSYHSPPVRPFNAEDLYHSPPIRAHNGGGTSNDLVREWLQEEDAVSTTSERPPPLPPKLYDEPAYDELPYEPTPDYDDTPPTAMTSQKREVDADEAPPEPHPDYFKEPVPPLTFTMPPADTTFTERAFRWVYKDVIIYVTEADITKLKTDVIVNAANPDMTHEGGIARAIADGAGPGLRAECAERVRAEGPLSVSRTYVSGAHALPCREVVHVVGPRWRDYPEEHECIQALYSALFSSLWEAESRGYTSVALPAISLGIYGVPLRVVTRALYKALLTFLKGTEKVTTIVLIDLNPDFLLDISTKLRVAADAGFVQVEVKPTP